MYLATINRRYHHQLGRRAVATLAVLGAALTCTAALAAPAAHAALAWGPYTCASGYVWRVVAADDLVCVTPADRYSVAVENQLGPSRKIPNSVYCLSGYVWREARPSDLVCVPPQSRTREYWNNLDSVWRLEDPSATPRGGVSVVGSARTTATTGYVYVYGGGLSPGGSALFCRVDIVNGIKYTCDDLGSLRVDWNGYVSGRLTWYGSCTTRPGYSSMIVVLDERNGRVNTAGTTNLINC